MREPLTDQQKAIAFVMVSKFPPCKEEWSDQEKAKWLDDANRLIDVLTGARGESVCPDRIPSVDHS